MQTMRQDAETILRSAIQAVLPDEAVRRALSGRVFPGKVYLVAAGKAAYRMAAAAAEMVPGLAEGVVITKYGHLGPPIGNLRMLEAGHPTPDENSFRAAEEALRLAGRAGEGDTVLFLCSAAGRISSKSTPSANGFPPSKAGGSPSAARRPGSFRSSSRTSSATHWT